MRQKKVLNKGLQAVLIVLVIGWYLIKGPTNASIGGVQLDKCVDGDTVRLRIEGKNEKVRFLAVDAPEMNPLQPYAIEAKDFTCDRLKEAKEIKVQFDPKADKRDKYDRMLLWIYVDGELLQELLVKEGLAKVKYIYNDYQHVDMLKLSQKTAQYQKKGMWK